MVDPSLLIEARTAVERFYDAIEQQSRGSTRLVTATLKQSLVDVFARLDGGVRLSLRQSLSGLLSLTSSNAMVSWSSLALEEHPFDSARLSGGKDGGIVSWILAGGHMLCPSCNTSMHLDKIASKDRIDPLLMFDAYNECLRAQRKEFCCSNCSKVLPESDSSHFGQCLNSHLDSQELGKPEGTSLTWIESPTLNLWKGTIVHVCPVATCTHPDWRSHQDKPWLSAVSLTTESRPRKRDKPQYGAGRFAVFKKSWRVWPHIGSHFFDYEIVSGKFEISFRTPRLDGKVVCPIDGCQWQLKAREGDGGRTFICHLVNEHRLPMLRYGNGDFVEHIDEDRLHDLKPYLTTLSEVDEGVPVELVDGVRDSRVYVIMKSKLSNLPCSVVTTDST